MYISFTCTLCTLVAEIIEHALAGVSHLESSIESDQARRRTGISRSGSHLLYTLSTMSFSGSPALVWLKVNFDGSCVLPMKDEE